ncbi:MAG: oxidoreductase [Sphingomonadales bacterium]|nr:oxidoreductase [Sphingomonadales bacterium]
MLAGVIGLGQIGGGVAVCLARANMLAAVYDVRTEASDTLEGVPKPLASARSVAELCEIVLIAVVDAAQCENVLSGPEGILAKARKGLTVVILSTIALDDLNRLRTLVEEAGARLVDCGVTGGLKAAQNGLVCMVGGTNRDLAAVLPVLNGFSREVVHMGGPGTGMAAKIARNVIVYNIWRATYEGAQLAIAAGVDIKRLAHVIDASADSTGGPCLWLNRASDPHEDEQEYKIREVGIKTMRKDLDAAILLGENYGLNLPMAELTYATAEQITGLKVDPPKSEILPTESDAFTRGLQMFERVYGPGSSESLVGQDRSPFAQETVSHLFADIWSRPNLSVRDRRMLLIGVTAMLGRADLIEIQIKAGLINGELTVAQLDEMSLFLAFYVGWCNSGPLYSGILKAKRAVEQMDLA